MCKNQTGYLPIELSVRAIFMYERSGATFRKFFNRAKSMLGWKKHNMGRKVLEHSTEGSGWEIIGSRYTKGERGSVTG